jgi:hypothetical protein
MDIRVEIFSVGKWNGIDFDRSDLQLMAAAFDKLKENHKVPLKFGHNDEQPFTDGQPALGWTDSLEVVDDKLVANLTDVPEVVFSAVQNKLYRHVSIELDFGVNYKGDHYPFVISGIALLGADIPAVNNIGDLTKYMARKLDSSKRAAFTAITQKQTFKVGDPMDIKEMQAKLEAMEKKLIDKDSQLADLAADKAKFERSTTDLQAKVKLQEEAAKKAHFERKKTELTDAAEALVKEGKIAPAQREAFMAQYKDDDSVIESMESNLKVLGMFSKSNEGEQGSNQDANEKGKNPAEVLFSRAKKHQVDKGVDFKTARDAVMSADPDLAREYITMT